MIRITSDSTCDLGKLVQERNIGIMSLQVNLGIDVYKDGVDITPQDIFAYVEKTKELPKTSAPSIADYEEFFKEQLAFGDEIIHFNISSKSSGSHNFAKQAAESFKCSGQTPLTGNTAWELQRVLTDVWTVNGSNLKRLCFPRTSAESTTAVTE